MSQFHDILVKGGFSGKKLHRASNGSSCLACGHWTKTHVTRFQVADDVSDETLKKFHDDGYEMCEKCFPQFAEANADKPKAYNGPRYHLERIRPYFNTDEGVIKIKRFRGSSCGRGEDMAFRLKSFRETYKESPEKCCKGCVKRYLEVEEQIEELKKANA